MFNVRSCKRNFGQFLSCFSNVLTYFTCILLVETWLTKDRDVSYVIPGFYSYDLYRDQFGGGIKLYVKDGVRTRLIDEYTFLNDLFEVLTVEFMFNCKKIICTAIYHPPSSSHANNNAFVLSFTSFLRNVFSHHIPTIVCGDFNMNLLNPNKFTYIESFVNGMFELGLAPLITIPTKINLENPITKFSVLDQFWVTLGKNVKHAFVTPVDITDHFPVGISIHLLANCWSTQACGKTRTLSDRGKFTFRMLLSNLNFTITGSGINEVFDSYFKKIFEMYEKAFPLTSGKISNKESAPWTTHKLQQCIK